uniref:Uncharacterized protein n=1 Tax=Cacopsylla melanoneura TaxID=428564 RepID=A0A8D8Q976_9HEMI
MLLSITPCGHVVKWTQRCQGHPLYAGYEGRSLVKCFHRGQLGNVNVTEKVMRPNAQGGVLRQLGNVNVTEKAMRPNAGTERRIQTTWECQCYREGNETKCRDRAAY